MKKILLLSLLASFCVNGQDWNVDIPNPESKSRFVSLLSFYSKSISDNSSYGLYKKYGIDTRKGISVSEFMSSEIDMVQQIDSKPHLCHKKSKSCETINYQFSGFKRLPVTKAEYWVSSFDLSKGQIEKTDGIVRSSNMANSINKESVTVYKIANKKRVSYFDINFEIISLFGASIIGNYVESGNLTFDKCSTLKFSYYCNKGKSGYFIDMANFTKSVIDGCVLCKEDDLFLLNYLKSRYLMRVMDKQVNKDAFKFLRSNKDKIEGLNLEYHRFEQIYRQSLLM